MEPRIQYVKTSDGVNIAYYAMGNGPVLIGMSPNLGFNIQDEWLDPRGQRGLATTARAFTLVRYDPRGCGLSDREVENFSLEAMVSDLAAVADQTASVSFALIATGGSAPVGVAYAAANPERVSHLVLWNVVPRTPVESLDDLLRMAQSDWRLASESWASAVDNWTDANRQRTYAAMIRRSVAPETFVRHLKACQEWDVGEMAPKVKARTLVAHPRDHPYFSPEPARVLAATIPGARLVLVEGSSSYSITRAQAAPMMEFLSELLRVERPTPSEDVPSGTAVILFADIADSTALTESLGDTAFRAKARDLDATLRTVIREHAGTPIEGKLLGDGVLAVFTSARQAIEAALACARSGDDVALPLHLGLHAGDVIREDNNVYGGAVNVAARISGLSARGDVLVSETVRSLARTSAGVAFEDRGEQSLKGVGEPVRVWAVREGE